MDNNIINSSRIAKNTLMLYFRQILIMLVSLYTVRVILNALGADAYGTYNVIAGIVAMFSFLTSCIAGAAQRFFSYDLGKGGEDSLKETFSAILLIFIIVSFVVLFFAETVGLWFVRNRLKVDEQFKSAIIYIYQFSLISFVFVMFVSPFLACIIAHEDMQIYAWLSIIEAILKLGVALVVSHIQKERLVFYGLLLMCVSILQFLMYGSVCIKKYKGCRFSKKININYLKEISSFLGWNLFGSISGVVKNQGITILVNQFFNPVVIAARSISMQINAAVSSFAVNFSSAMNPQIVKQYAGQNYKEYHRLICRGAKYTFLLMWIFIIPLMSCMSLVLSLWLKNVPENTILFADLVLIETLLETISFPMLTGVQATGKVKHYQIILGCVTASSLPISWILFRFNFGAEWVFIVGIVINILCVFIRYVFLYVLTNLEFWLFCRLTLIPIILTSLPSILLFILYKLLIPETGLYQIIGALFNFFVVCMSIYIFGFDKKERDNIKKRIIEKFKK